MTQKLLEKMGTTAAQVAETLRAAGIKGDHGCHSCPVYRYLKAKGGEGAIKAAYSYSWEDIDGFTHKYPNAVKGFISIFDNGGYNDLYYE